MQAAIEAALAELALGPELAPSDVSGVAAWLARSGVSAEDARALTADLPRLLIYRKLVRGNLEEALRATMPRALARLGTLFEPDFSEFLSVAPPTSPYLRELTASYLDFVVPRWRANPSVPEYLADLARHEALQVEVASLLGQPKSHVAAELALDAGVEFIDAARLVHYDWAVQRLPDDTESRLLPEREAVSLLVYRSPEHEVRYLELAPFAEALLDGLLGQRLELQHALARAAERVLRPLDAELLTRAARLLAELAERGALLGKRADHPAKSPI